MNRKLPEYFLEKSRMTGMVTFTVLFAIVFLNIYIPFSDTAWFGLGNSAFFLATAGFIAVSVIFVVLSRILIYCIRKWIEVTWLLYVMWSLSEVVLISLFYTFVTLDVRHPDASPAMIFVKALFYGIIALIIPEIISGMYIAIIEKDRTIRMMNGTGAPADDESKKGGTRITLFDSRGALRLSVKSSNLYYIESDDNYIKVWYSDNGGELKNYMMRCPMKSVEENFRDGSLMRVHRKYIVNTEKVKVLRRENDGYFLDMDDEDIPPIAVTKTYISNVLGRFGAAQESAPA